MCGIVAVLTRPSARATPSAAEICRLLEAAVSALPAGAEEDAVTAAAGLVEEADRSLRGLGGVCCLVRDRSGRTVMEGHLAALGSWIAEAEQTLEAGGTSAGTLESTNAAIVRLKDATWAVRCDRLRTAVLTEELAGPDASDEALAAYAQVQIALAAIDRLEVRGRDSAGLHVFVRDHGLDLTSPSVQALVAGRTDDSLFRSGAVRTPEGHLAFVYKAAAEIGELGDNTHAIRGRVAADELLRTAVSARGATVSVLGHTRWASVGIISEANAHPLTHEEEGALEGPYVVATLNGDVDNYADLKASAGLRVPGEITTDAKVIPALVSRRIAEGHPPADAFRHTVASFDGSVAIAAMSASTPDQVMLALRGSGQALYVGLGEDMFVASSEPYGLIEQCRSYVRMDGESVSDVAGRGQVVILDGGGAGTVDGVTRMAYDGTPLPVEPSEVKVEEITTRDVDRGDYPHYLLKEISEAPRSFRNTLRGRLVGSDDRLGVVLGPDTLPPDLVAGLRGGRVRRVFVIGQGTAAVAGRSVAASIREAIGGTGVVVEAMAATELSGFAMPAEMSDTLVVAISQSGTTTDTLRTVELARGRGATVLGIVNRRGSDLTDRSHGVLYNSDGRDIEMAVPSTKAFYSQIAAGFLLARALADEMGLEPGPHEQELLRALRTLPEAMEKVLARREAIAEVARRHAPGRRHWAVVGSGPNRIAAEEVRIKLSELCYKAIACDLTEDKKHIDLSSEPLIVVCAAGLSGSNVEDVAKEIAIFRAHKAAPIVIAGEGEGLYPAALEVIGVPSVHPSLAFVLSAMAGHLFGYEAALAIDAQARMLREARAEIEVATRNGGRDADEVLRRLAPRIEPVARRFSEGLRSGEYNGHLEASTAVRLASLFRYAVGMSPLEVYPVEHGKIGTPSAVIEDLTDALTLGIDELTRPVDAIKHQAKTVTVGISRSDETYLQTPLVAEVVAAGAARDRLSYRTLRTLAALDPAVEAVTGYTHYRIVGPVDQEATIHVTDRGGIARDIPSRTDREPGLRGTKARVAAEREVLVTRGRRDGRTLVIVPEVKAVEVTGLVLLHVDLVERLSPSVMRAVLEGYRDRYAALRDLVTETEPVFRDDLLSEMPATDLLVDSVQLLAERWRSS